MKPTFFKTQAEFRRWLGNHHAAARELWVGFYQRLLTFWIMTAKKEER
jgi:hypothetical protein